MVFAPGGGGGAFLPEGEEIKLSSSSGNSSIFKHAGHFPASHTVSPVVAPQVEMALVRHGTGIISVTNSWPPR